MAEILVLLGLDYCLLRNLGKGNLAFDDLKIVGKDTTDDEKHSDDHLDEKVCDRKR